jgi:hypothetical protein
MALSAARWAASDAKSFAIAASAVTDPGLACPAAALRARQRLSASAGVPRRAQLPCRRASTASPGSCRWAARTRRATSRTPAPRRAPPDRRREPGPQWPRDRRRAPTSRAGSPSPGPPRSASASTRTLIKHEVHTAEPAYPQRVAAVTTLRQARACPLGTRNALTPRPRNAGCVAANTMATSATTALATQTLRPQRHVPVIVEPARPSAGWPHRSRRAPRTGRTRRCALPSSQSGGATPPSAPRSRTRARGSATRELFTTTMTATTALARASTSIACA